MDFLIMDAGDKYKGESKIDGYTGKIELLSFSHGTSMQITSDVSNQKRTSGKPNHQDFTVTKYVDLATCPIISACNSGTAIPDVKVYVLQNEEGKMNPILTFEMKNVLISSDSIGGGGGAKPVETVTMNYSAISWTYKPQVPEGDVKGQDAASWDLAANKASAGS
jgi:type VI secretion system secreted protein Hcp